MAKKRIETPIAVVKPVIPAKPKSADGMTVLPANMVKEFTGKESSGKKEVIWIALPGQPKESKTKIFFKEDDLKSGKAWWKIAEKGN